MKQTLGAPRYRPPIAAIRLGHSDRHPEEVRFGRLLVWYMRVLALLWFLQGAWHWWLVLRPDDGGAGMLTGITPIGIGAIAFYCVVDFICSVGLWLTAPWGGVVWIVTVLAQWSTTFVLPGFFKYDVAVAFTGLVLLLGYGFLLYKAARENAPYV